MPKIEKMFSLEITVEQFVRNCSDTELQEIFFAADAESNRRFGTIEPRNPKLECHRPNGKKVTYLAATRLNM